jgi:hypothetical protein
MESTEGKQALGPGALSRSTIGYAGIAGMLRRFNMPATKSRDDMLGKLCARRRPGDNECQAAQPIALVSGKL